MPPPLHLHSTWVSLQTPCQISPKKHQIFSPPTHLKIQGKSLPPIQILHQVTLPELNPNTLHNLIQLNYLQNKLHQLLIPPKKYTPPLEISQACLIYLHLRSHHNDLPHFLFTHQISTPRMDMPQAYHLWSQINSQWRIIPQLHHLHQINLPVNIHPHYHQKQQQHNSLTLSPQQKIPQIYQHQYIWLLLLINVLSPVPFQVPPPLQFQELVPQIHSSLLIHM